MKKSLVSVLLVFASAAAVQAVGQAASQPAPPARAGRAGSKAGDQEPSCEYNAYINAIQQQTPHRKLKHWKRSFRPIRTA